MIFIITESAGHTAAASIDERIKHVQTPDFVAPKMELYYNKHPLKLVVTGTKHEVSSPVPQSNRQFHIFQLTTPQHLSGFPVSVEETKHGCLVDWTSFVQFHDNLLGKFIRIYQPQPDTFHAMRWIRIRAAGQRCPGVRCFVRSRNSCTLPRAVARPLQVQSGIPSVPPHQ